MSEQNVLTREVTFNFKKIPAAKLAALIANIDDAGLKETAQASFEVLKDESGKETGDVKRKPVTATITLPEFCAGLDPLGLDIIANYVSQFVKANFVDEFLPVGDHSWESIKKAAETSGGRTVKFDISEEVFTAACASIGAFVGQSLNNSDVGKKFQLAVEGKLSRTAIQRNIGVFSEDILNKLNVWLQKWAEFVAEHEAENAEDYTAVFEMLTAKLDKHLSAETLNVAELL